MSKTVRRSGRCGIVLLLTAVIGVGLCRTVPAAGETSPETAAVTSPEKPADAKVGADTKAAGPSGQAEETERKYTLLKIIQMGGPLMYVLFALSIWMVAMVTYFFLAFSPGNIMPPAFLRRIQQIVRDKKMDEARMYCAQNRNMVSHIIRGGLEAVQKGPRGVLEAMSSEGSRRASSLWQKINFLSDIAVIAPMVGLLGTVIGMFQAFMGITQPGGTAVGTIKPAALTSGVAQAVITTIAGLIIGILATMAYSYFRGVVQRIVVNLEAVCSRYSDMIAEGIE